MAVSNLIRNRKRFVKVLLDSKKGEFIMNGEADGSVRIVDRYEAFCADPNAKKPKEYKMSLFPTNDRIVVYAARGGILKDIYAQIPLYELRQITFNKGMSGKKEYCVTEFIVDDDADCPTIVFKMETAAHPDDLKQYMLMLLGIAKLSGVPIDDYSGETPVRRDPASKKKKKRKNQQQSSQPKKQIKRNTAPAVEAMRNQQQQPQQTATPTKGQQEQANRHKQAQAQQRKKQQQARQQAQQGQQQQPKQLKRQPSQQQKQAQQKVQRPKQSQQQVQQRAQQPRKQQPQQAQGAQQQVRQQRAQQQTQQQPQQQQARQTQQQPKRQIKRKNDQGK